MNNSLTNLLKSSNVLCYKSLSSRSKTNQDHFSDIQRSYQACGWRAHFLTQTGVSNHSGEGTFYSDGAMQMKEWGGGVLPPDVISEARNASAETISLLRLSDFLRDVVGKRQMPIDSNRDQVERPQTALEVEVNHA